MNKNQLPPRITLIALTTSILILGAIAFIAMLVVTRVHRDREFAELKLARQSIETSLRTAFSDVNAINHTRNANPMLKTCSSAGNCPVTGTAIEIRSAKNSVLVGNSDQMINDQGQACVASPAERTCRWKVRAEFRAMASDNKVIQFMARISSLPAAPKAMAISDRDIMVEMPRDMILGTLARGCPKAGNMVRSISETGLARCATTGVECRRLPRPSAIETNDQLAGQVACRKQLGEDFAATSHDICCRITVN